MTLKAGDIIIRSLKEDKLYPKRVCAVMFVVLQAASNNQFEITYGFFRQWRLETDVYEHRLENLDERWYQLYEKI